MNVVVLGAGQAGCQVVCSLRESGFAGGIVLVGAEEHPPYQRPPLSKGHLNGTALRETLWLRPESWFSEHDIDVRLGVSATSIDRADRCVSLDDGTTLHYDVLVLAVGSRHRELDLPGASLDGVLALRTLVEADKARARLQQAADVVIVGGGFIGMEVAATAAKLGKATTVIELAPQLMGRVLTAETAGFLVDAHRRRGLTIELSTSLRAIEGQDGEVSGVVLSDGRRLSANLVVLGIGAVAETDLARAAGLEVNAGIAVDASLRTTDPSIFAVGDCACGPNPYADGRTVRIESVQNAVDQGRCVAAAILGRGEPFDAVPWFWSDQANLKLQIAGLTHGHDAVVVTGSMSEERFSTWCFVESRLVGVESVNRIPDHMAARKLLASRTRIGPDEVAAPGFDVRAAAKSSAV
jgi:3-phenylpropionate/trans-cinnamate dioxygenase ferredoxin reductase component